MDRQAALQVRILCATLERDRCDRREKEEEREEAWMGGSSHSATFILCWESHYSAEQQGKREELHDKKPPPRTAEKSHQKRRIHDTVFSPELPAVFRRFRAGRDWRMGCGRSLN